MVYKWNVTIPKLSGDKPRRAYIWLPEDYEKQPDKRYPVMYMFDGHNVFFDSDATFGKSWGMAKFMGENPKDLIIVAVECNHEGNRRLVEYAPMTYTNSEHGHIKGKGAVMMNWMVNTLKPYIDENYRTLPDRKNTIIAGSSMGGLMSLYAACHYSDVFSRFACLSPSVWVHPGKVKRMLRHARIAPDTILYLDYGAQELGNHKATGDVLPGVFQSLYSQGVNVTMRIVPYGVHSEECWEQQIPVFMACLGFI